MKHLLQVEWMKLKHYRAFKVFGILYLLGIIGVLFVTYLMFQNIPQAEIIRMLSNPFAYPALWNTTGWLNSWLLFFPGWLIINLCVNEFNFKTHRQNIIDGWSRQQFIGAKLLLILFFAIVITVINIISCLLMGLFMNAPISFEGFEYMGFVFIQSLAYLLFAFMLAILLRKSGLAAGIFFMYGLIFDFLFAQLINYTFHMKPVGYFLPLQVSDDLFYIPFLKNALPGVPSAYALVAGCLIYCAGYTYFALRKFKRDDL